MYFVYFLRSESNPEQTYTGQTENLARRMIEHNEGTGIGHTRRYRPWRLEAFILADTRQTAERAEEYFKTPSGQQKFERFAEANPDHPNPITGFFASQTEGRLFGRRESGFVIEKTGIVSVTMAQP
ncbi:MAG: GIY-YIG nuclease family protein [Alphaproteobacteria bacterium]|nr:GIY-YIG nuclease family protein [Alphaproteobacteria bacterium]